MSDAAGDSVLRAELRRIALEQIRTELYELAANRVPKLEQEQFVFAEIFLTHKLGLISDAEFDEFEALVRKHGR